MFTKKNHKVETITPHHNKLSAKISRKLKPVVSITKPIYIFVLVTAVIISAYHTVFANRIIPGVLIGNTNVGGLTYKEALDRLKNSEAKLNKDITYNYENKTFKINKEDIKFEYKWEATLSRAYEIGRTRDIFTDTKDKIAGFFKYLSIKPFYDYDDVLLSAKLLGIGAEVAKEGSDAKLSIKGRRFFQPVRGQQRRAQVDVRRRMVGVQFDGMAQIGNRSIGISQLTADSPQHAPCFCIHAINTANFFKQHLCLQVLAALNQFHGFSLPGSCQDIFSSHDKDMSCYEAHHFRHISRYAVSRLRVNPASSRKGEAASLSRMPARRVLRRSRSPARPTAIFT